MDSGRSQRLMTLREEIAKLRQQIDVLEHKCAKRGCLRAHSSSPVHEKSNPEPVRKPPTVNLIAYAGGNAMNSVHCITPSKQVTIPKSRIPRCSLPNRPNSAAAALPSRSHGESKTTTKEEISYGGSKMSKSRSSKLIGSISEPHSLHSSVSSLMSMGSGRAVHKPSNPRHQSHAVGGGRDVDEVGSCGQGIRLPGCCIMSSKIPRFSRRNSSKPSMEPRCSSALGRRMDVTEHRSTGHSRSLSSISASKFEDYRSGVTSPNLLSFSLAPGHAKMKNYSRTSSPSPQRSLPGFDVGHL